ncbi:MAG: hypothetical protein R3A79_13760 [Nannocystaceae bacterium]
MGPLDVSITPLLFLSTQSLSAAAKAAMVPAVRLATAAKRPSTLTAVRDGLALVVGSVR